MDTTKDEFNIPNVIMDPRTRTQYSKGKFLGKVSARDARVSTRRLVPLAGWLRAMLRTDRYQHRPDVCRQSRSEINARQTPSEREGRRAATPRAAALRPAD